MLRKIKKLFYFPFASYFRFFAQIRLYFWRPQVIVITGSNGKTTLFHIVESQLGEIAKYSYKANSSFGIPFDILGLHRKNLTYFEWPMLLLLAPFSIFRKLPSQKIYVVEVDCDRQGEGHFLSTLLNPDITLWTNVARTHSGNFDKNGFKSIDAAIAHEFGNLSRNTKSLVIANGDNELIKEELKDAKCDIQFISLKDTEEYLVDINGTKFKNTFGVFNLPFLLPKEVSMSIEMALNLDKHLSITPDKTFSKLNLAPGRSSVLKGIKNTTLIDSTYNANLDSMKAIIDMYGQIKHMSKWVVLGDMLEQGSQEEEEHIKLAQVISNNKFEKIILMGPRIIKYTYLKLINISKKDDHIERFLRPDEVLKYLSENIKGGEMILFKGARFLEGVIENLLEDKSDVVKLPRREKAWEIRRKKWGL